MFVVSKKSPHELIKSHVHTLVTHSSFADRSFVTEKVSQQIWVMYMCVLYDLCL